MNNNIMTRNKPSVGEKYEKRMYGCVKDKLRLACIPSTVIPNALLFCGNNKADFNRVRNAYINGGRRVPDQTCEIDLLIINRKGIFCIECKAQESENFWPLMGGVHEAKWNYRKKYGEKGVDKDNPIRQNVFHCNVLKKIVGDKNIVNIFSKNLTWHDLKVVLAYDKRYIKLNLFKNFCFLEKEKIPSYVTIDAGGMKKMIRKMKRMPNLYDKDEVQRIVEKINLMKIN